MSTAKAGLKEGVRAKAQRREEAISLRAFAPLREPFALMPAALLLPR
jgi:hypothetical protein